jgi:alkaline phosphatase
VLADLTKKAIEILAKEDDGFFLMVEGSQIDWAGHENLQDYLIGETVDFDDAVGVGLDFAEKDGETLVIVTSDHECGGFAVHDGSMGEKKVTKSGFTCDEHTASMVPVFAYGPGSKAFGGIIDNTDIGKLMIRYVIEAN